MMGTLTAERLSIIGQPDTRLVIPMKDVAFSHDVTINFQTLAHINEMLTINAKESSIETEVINYNVLI